MMNIMSTLFGIGCSEVSPQVVHFDLPFSLRLGGIGFFGVLEALSEFLVDGPFLAWLVD